MESSPKKTVLIVEDSDVIRTLLGRILSQRGFTIAEASGGQEALVLLKKQKIDFIISDLDMPTGDGASFLGFLKQEKNTIPVLICTGYTDATLDNYASYGIKALVHKPIDTQVVDQIMSFLQS